MGVEETYSVSMANNVNLSNSLSGNKLDASTAWSIYSVFAAMQFTVGTLPFAARSIAESVVCFRNFQVRLRRPATLRCTLNFLRVANVLYFVLFTLL